MYTILQKPMSTGKLKSQALYFCHFQTQKTSNCKTRELKLYEVETINVLLKLSSASLHPPPRIKYINICPQRNYINIRSQKSPPEKKKKKKREKVKQNQIWPIPICWSNFRAENSDSAPHTDHSNQALGPSPVPGRAKEQQRTELSRAEIIYWSLNLNNTHGNCEIQFS